MSHTVLENLCIGCGACDYSCPSESLYKTDTFLGVFAIDPFTCDDCGICVAKCPELAIVPDPQWPTCHGHGCPLTSKRLEHMECAIWQHRCPTCAATMWRNDDLTWSCPTCDMGMRVHCPREKFVATFVKPPAATH